MGTTDRQAKWDKRFLKMAALLSENSKDPTRKCGAVIVRPDMTAASQGFNGFPSRMPDNVKNYDNREEKLSRVIHAEMNAILFAREKLEGYTIYVYPFLPCDRCSAHIIQAGIARVVATHTPKMTKEKREKWEPIFAKSRQYFEECGVEVCFEHMDDGEE